MNDAGTPDSGFIERLYAVMERELGPTDWWPAETLFEIMVGAVLTQNTAWGNVDRSLAALKAAGMLEPHAIAATGPIAADSESASPSGAATNSPALEDLIRPSGFYRNKARALRSLSRWYIDRCGADPAGVADVPDDALRAELLSLFGVGGETADDLMLYVFSRRTFVADTYARRLFAFLGFAVPAGYPAFHKAFAPAVLASGLDVAQLQEFHGLIDEFGKAYRDERAKAGSFLAGWR
ncbi:endonuclease III domain-containing protein [Bifidobacterium platyrrhinorum]|nr:DNA lyase [Bifidobacterium platyrrhinorum]